jgi:hypothetical protein
MLSQNQIIVGPQNDCALKKISKNVHTSSEWFDVTGVTKLKITTFQHRTYDKSKIYSETGELIWQWSGESYSDTWYKKEHFLDINTNKIIVEFTQGYNDPFCDGYIKVEKLNFDSQKSDSQDVKIASVQNLGNLNRDENSDNIERLKKVEFSTILNRLSNTDSKNSKFSKEIKPYPSNPSDSYYKTDYYNNKIIYEGYVKEVVSGSYGGSTVKELIKYGKGKEYFTNSDGYYEGYFINNKLNGYGTCMLNGYSYKGYFENGQMSGEGILVNDGLNGGAKYLYEGNFSNNKYNGVGTLINSDMAYLGEFVNGEMNGVGFAWYSGGSKYYGYFTNGNFDRNGVYYRSNGDYYQGNFNNGMENGEGEMIYANGKKLKGFFQNGVYVGKENKKLIQSNSVQNLSTNKFQNSKLSELTVDGETISAQIQNMSNKLYTDIYAQKITNSILGVKTNPNSQQNLINTKNRETKSIVEGWLGGPMTKSQLVEFNSINKKVLSEVQVTMGFVTMALNSPSASSKSSKSSTYNAWQCDRCATISHLDREPSSSEFGGSRGCYGDRYHHWREVNTKRGWQCSRCATISHLDQEPSSSEFGGSRGCNGDRYHDWRQF